MPSAPVARRAETPLGALLARWWCWRSDYRTERSYARQGGTAEPDDALEDLLMRSIEAEVAQLPISDQRAVDQVARDECLGVDNGGMDEARRALALEHLRLRLQRSGVLV